MKASFHFRKCVTSFQQINTTYTQGQRAVCGSIIEFSFSYSYIMSEWGLVCIFRLAICVLPSPASGQLRRQAAAMPCHISRLTWGSLQISARWHGSLSQGKFLNYWWDEFGWVGAISVCVGDATLGFAMPELNQSQPYSKQGLNHYTFSIVAKELILESALTVLRDICDTRGRAWVSHQQGKRLSPCTIFMTPVPKMFIMHFWFLLWIPFYFNLGATPSFRV